MVEPDAVITDLETQMSVFPRETDRAFGGLSVAQTIAHGFARDIDEMQDVVFGEKVRGFLIDAEVERRPIRDEHGSDQIVQFGAQVSDIPEILGKPFDKSTDVGNGAIHLRNGLVEEFVHLRELSSFKRFSDGGNDQSHGINGLEHVIVKVLTDPRAFFQQKAKAALTFFQGFFHLFSLRQVACIDDYGFDTMRRLLRTKRRVGHGHESFFAIVKLEPLFIGNDFSCKASVEMGFDRLDKRLFPQQVGDVFADQFVCGKAMNLFIDGIHAAIPIIRSDDRDVVR